SRGPFGASAALVKQRRRRTAWGRPPPAPVASDRDPSPPIAQWELRSGQIGLCRGMVAPGPAAGATDLFSGKGAAGGVCGKRITRSRLPGATLFSAKRPNGILQALDC